MGIDGLGQSNIIRLRQLMAQGNNPAAKVRVPQKDVRLTRDGSIFDAPKTRTTTTTTTQSQNTQSQSQTQGQGEITVSEGLAAASSAKKLVTQAKSGRVETEKGAKQVKEIGNSSQKLASAIARDEKKMQKAMKKDQRVIDLNNGKMRTLSGQIQTEVAAQAKLTEELKALQNESQYSVYSLSLDPGGGNTGPDNSDKIQAIQAKLASSGARISRYSGSLAKLRTANSRTIRTMNRTSRKYQQQVAKNKQQINSNQSTSDKIMNVANKVGEISMYTSMAGQGVQIIAKLMRYIGESLVAAGAATFGASAAVGQALITASVPVEETGVVVETVGNYGSTAASATKAAVSIANGDIQGALTNVLAATMTAAAAVKGTTQISSGFASIKQEAQAALNSGKEALQNNIAKNAAKQEVADKTKGMSRKAIKEEFGMSKKELTKQAQASALDNVKASSADMNVKDLASAARDTGSEFSTNVHAAAQGGIHSNPIGNTATASTGTKFSFKKLSLASMDKSTAKKAATSMQQFGQGLMAMSNAFNRMGVFGQTNNVANKNINYDYSRGNALLNSIYGNPKIVHQRYRA